MMGVFLVEMSRNRPHMQTHGGHAAWGSLGWQSQSWGFPLQSLARPGRRGVFVRAPFVPGSWRGTPGELASTGSTKNQDVPLEDWLLAYPAQPVKVISAHPDWL